GLMPVSMTIFFLCITCLVAHRWLQPFPPRRSSDLVAEGAIRASARNAVAVDLRRQPPKRRALRLRPVRAEGAARGASAAGGASRQRRRCERWPVSRPPRRDRKSVGEGKAGASGGPRGT